MSRLQALYVLHAKKLFFQAGCFTWLPSSARMCGRSREGGELWAIHGRMYFISVNVRVGYCSTLACVIAFIKFNTFWQINIFYENQLNCISKLPFLTSALEGEGVLEKRTK